jgi:hypothetical protein
VNTGEKGESAGEEKGADEDDEGGESKAEVEARAYQQKKE